MERKPLVAMLLSLVVPGLGQLYNQQPVKSFIVFVISVTFYYFFYYYYSALDTPSGSLVFLVFNLLIYGYILIDCFVVARKRRFSLSPKWYNSNIAYVLIWLTVILIYSLIFKIISHEKLYFPFKVDNHAMSDTIKKGDIIIAKYSSEYFKNIRRGDMIVFKKIARSYSKYSFAEIKELREKNGKIDESVILRVVGLPGEKVEVQGDNVFINDKKISEPYAYYKNLLAGTNFPARIVPKDKLFVMGDNRTEAMDSRHFMDTFIPFSKVSGVAMYIANTEPYDQDRVGTLLY